LKILILSCNTGQGHNAVAMALEEAFHHAGHTVVVKDTLDYVSHQISSMIAKGHSYLYRHFPRLNDTGYQYVEKHKAILDDRSPLYRLLLSGSERLYRFLRRRALTQSSRPMCMQASSGQA